MLSDAIGGLLPSALAVALSPIPIVAVVLLLSSPRARATGPAFALGWVVGLAAVGAVVLVVLQPGSDADLDDPGVGWLNVALGAVFLVMAARQWRKRPRQGAEPAMPGWMATIDSASPGRCAVLGLALSAANPKNLALTVAASASIAEAALSGADKAIAVAAFVAIGSLTVVGAVLYYLFDADRATRPLASVKEFMAANNAAIMVVMLLLLGAKLIGDGLDGI